MGAALVNELMEAKQNNQVRRMTARWQKYELIAPDEFGYLPLADVGAEFLFQVVSYWDSKGVSVRPRPGVDRKQMRAPAGWSSSPRSRISSKLRRAIVADGK